MRNDLWPSYQKPGDLSAIEAVRLADRGLPPTTYALLAVIQLTDGSDEVRVQETPDRFAITFRMEKS